MEVSNWEQYTAFLTQWASASAGFETVIRRVSELPQLVYLEVEERHTRPDGQLHVVNSLSVYEFTDEGKVRHLDVYLQQKLPRGTRGLLPTDGSVEASAARRDTLHG